MTIRPEDVRMVLPLTQAEMSYPTAMDEIVDQMARLSFARQVKQSGIDPNSLDIYCEFYEDEEMVFIYADDHERTTRATIAFPLNPKAWTKSLMHEVTKLFRGSAILAARGR